MNLQIDILVPWSEAVVRVIAPGTSPCHQMLLVVADVHCHEALPSSAQVDEIFWLVNWPGIIIHVQLARKDGCSIELRMSF